MLDIASIGRMADQLYRAYREMKIVEPFRHSPGDTATEADAYRIQAAWVQQCCAHGASVGGYKIGFTAGEAPNPAYGRILRGRMFVSGAQEALASFLQPGVEAEIAFRLGKRLDAPPFTRSRVADAVDCVLPALEIVESRFIKTRRERFDIICDNCSFGAAVLGEPIQKVLPQECASLAVNLEVQDAQVRQGSAKNVMGDPLEALIWLAERLYADGIPLGCNDVVLSGSLIPLVPISQTAQVTADFGKPGKVAFRFAPF